MRRTLWLLVALVVITSASVMLTACGSSEPGQATTVSTAASTAATTAAPATSATTAQAAQPAGGETIRLTYNNFFPPTNYHSLLAEWWIKQIEQQTNGAIQFEYLPGASLSTADKVYDSVLEGMCDIGFSCVVYTMGRFPSTEILDRPIGHINPWVSSIVENEFYQKFQPKEFDDTHVLYMQGSNMANAFLATKAVRKTADFKGLIIRSTGVGSQIAEALGGTGYAAPVNEAYELLSKGVVDGSMSGMDVLIGWKQAEVIKYITNLGPATSSTTMYVVMNKDKWDGLPEEYKKILTDVSAGMPAKHGLVWMYYDKASADYFMSLPDREMIQVPADDVVNLEKAAQAVVDKYIADKASLDLPVDDYMAFFKERSAFWAPQTPSVDEAIEFVKTELDPLKTK